MYFIYSVALGVALLLSSPYWIWQAMRHGKYRAGFSERIGKVPDRLRSTHADENCIWIHAVSVGEVIAITPLVRALAAKLGAGWRIVVSTTTMTGQQLARQAFGEDNVFYLPLDFAFALSPFFERLRPRAVILAETEFWPNLLRMAREKNARVAVVNARISDRSFPRYLAFRRLLKIVLENIDLFLAQTETDRERLVAVGADAARVQVAGNLKFEAAATKSSELVTKVRSAVSGPVLVCGSTVEGEEEVLLPAFRQIFAVNPSATVILAPRHPERFPAVAATLQSSEMKHVKRSEWRGESLAGSVLLLDTIGELAAVYELATAAFVGGSLVPRGGHNILEPARFGKPIFVGPYTQNFRDIIATFSQAKAVHVIDPTHVEDELAGVFEDEWRSMGERGRGVFQAQSGALQRTLDALEVLLWMPSSIKARYQQVTR
jgi:3-deoxy-D-manno-octulosonic-acid transferase